MLDPQGLALRSRFLQAIRGFFCDRGYNEVDTPIRLPALIPEAEIEPVVSGDRWLHTSPELCMKRLLARGAGPIFQICHCFRAGEQGRLHRPEFTLLEWYRPGSDYRDLMGECEELFAHLARSCRDCPALVSARSLKRGARLVDLSPPWERITVAQAFSRYTHTSAEQALAAGCFDELLVSRIEPNLGWERPVFLYDYPAALASLARVRTDNPALAERFEIYLAGIELANGFSELVDAGEQRRRFLREQELARQKGRTLPLPEKFLADLQRMEPAAGIALGVDRLFLLFLGVDELGQAMPLAPEEC